MKSYGICAVLFCFLFRKNGGIKMYSTVFWYFFLSSLSKGADKGKELKGSLVNKL